MDQENVTVSNFGCATTGGANAHGLALNSCVKRFAATVTMVLNAIKELQNTVRYEGKSSEEFLALHNIVIDKIPPTII